MQRLTIYSRNVFGVPVFARRRAERLRGIVAQARGAGADIIFLQEIFMPGERRALKRHLDSGYETSRAHAGLFRLGGGLSASARPGLNMDASFVRFPRSGTFRDMTVGDRLAAKGFQALKAALPTDESASTPGSPAAITFLNTHLTCPYEDIDGGGHKEAILESQLATMEAFIRGVNGPLVICGDFNMDASDRIMADFMRRSGLTDHSAHLPATVLGNFFSPQWLFRDIIRIKKIDHILTKNIPAGWTIDVQPADDGDAFLSDHLGLIARIEMREA